MLEIKFSFYVPHRPHTLYSSLDPHLLIQLLEILHVVVRDLACLMVQIARELGVVTLVGKWTEACSCRFTEVGHLDVRE